MARVIAIANLALIRFQRAWWESEIEHLDRQIIKQKKIIAQCDRKIIARYGNV